MNRRAKSTQIVLKFGFIIFCVFLIACSSSKQESAAKKDADFIIEHLDKYSVMNKFSSKYFPQQTIHGIIQEIKEECNWENRKGGLSNIITRSGSINQITIQYEFELICDNLRFSLTYDLNSDYPKLISLTIDRI